MLSLTQNLKTSYWYKGKEYPLDLSFDNVLRFYELLDDDHFTADEKVAVAFEMFFNFPATKTEDTNFVVTAFDEISRYLAQTPYDTGESDEDMNGQPVPPAPKAYSFKQDAEAIYASFRQQYGINLLHEQGKMHWDEFKALFAALGPDTYFQRIIDIRTRDTSDLKGSVLADVIAAKQAYELEENKTEQAKQNQLAGFMSTLKSWATS